ncbi:Hypothetical protein FSTVST1_18 [Faustovirus ST1]|nr:Hypothetical protein FSTVST1_18 [Faustovirus ST1]
MRQSAIGNNYTCVAYSSLSLTDATDHNCSVMATMAPGGVAMPTHCTTHARSLKGMYRQPVKLTCVMPNCNNHNPVYGMVNSTATLCESCYNKTAVNTPNTLIVDTRMYCRISNCRMLATHGASGDVRPWICAKHATTLMFTCSVVYKSKCVTCPQHAVYYTDSGLKTCGFHHTLLTNIPGGNNPKPITECQLFYCTNAVNRENTLGELYHSLCCDHIELAPSVKLCDVSPCRNYATVKVDSRDVCDNHLPVNYSLSTSYIVDPKITKSENLQRNQISALINNLPRTLDHAGITDVVNKLMSVTPSKNTQLIGTKRSISQVEAVVPPTVSPITTSPPTPVPTQITTPDSCDLSTVNTKRQKITHEPSIECVATPNYTPNYTSYDSSEYSDVLQSNQLSPASYSQACDLSSYDEYNEYSPTLGQLDDICVQNSYIVAAVLNNYKLEYMYHSTTKVYQVNAYIPMFISIDPECPFETPPFPCVIIKIHSITTVDTLMELFDCIHTSYSQPHRPRISEYAI